MTDSNDKPLYAVAVDDEKDSLMLMERVIARFPDKVRLKGTADSVDKAHEVILEKDPDIVFLDIHLNGRTGFELLDSFDSPRFKTVFVTADDQQALKAIKYSAFDYIMKPVNINEVEDTVERISKTNFPTRDQYVHFKNNLLDPENTDPRIALPEGKTMRMVPLEDISQVYSDDGVVIFELTDGNKLFSSYSLKYYEDLLPSMLFFRIHRSRIINRISIESYDTGRGGVIRLVSGSEVELSVRKKTGFLNWLRANR
jgi:two-component system LytT family response regulator